MKKSKNKEWTIITLLIMAALLLGIVVMTVIIDPFFMYHAPTKPVGYTISNENYQNPGIARSFDYNAVVLGSSMVQNTSTQQIDELFGVRSVKLTYSGAYAHNFKEIMDVVQLNAKVDRVIWGIDIYSLLQSADETRNPLPNYLYDTNLLNDIEYVLNKDVLIKNVQVLRNARANRSNTSIDNAYNWYAANESNFNSKAVITHYNNTRGGENVMKPIDAYLEIVVQNLEQNIIPIIESNTNTEFIVFFPPYSILYWDNVKHQGDLYAYLYIEQILIEELLEYENVEVYYFQQNEDIVCNIANYKDITHYHPDVNRYLIEAMSEGQYQVTEDTYMQVLENMRGMVENCDVEGLIAKYQ